MIEKTICSHCGQPKTPYQQWRRSGGFTTAFRCKPCQTAHLRETIAKRKAGIQPTPTPKKGASESFSPAVRAAVRVGMDAPSAHKLRGFCVVRMAQGSGVRYLTHVPTETLNFPAEDIVLLAMLDETGHWRLKSPTTTGTQL